MTINEKCANRIITFYLNPQNDFILIYDHVYKEMGSDIQKAAKRIGLTSYMMEIDCFENADASFQKCLELNLECIVLVSEFSFRKLKLPKYLDFSKGAPLVGQLQKPSYVSVFPLESAMRIYSSNIDQDQNVCNSILSNIKNNSQHRIKTESGTDLTFFSRKWNIHGNEVLTAPIEESINGIIAVDGALFFRKIPSVIYVKIEKGIMTDVFYKSEQERTFVDEYITMTQAVFSEEKNKQLAEVGIGFNTNAIISDCFMESEMVYGTCHFCFGNNECYGGANKSEFHGASVLINKPRFILL